MNYLQICQRLAFESGTVQSKTLPASVTGQTALRLLHVIDDAATAYNDIQNLHSNWRWLEGEFTGTLSASTARYTASGSFSLTRFAEWIHDSPRKRIMSIYKVSLGVSDEGVLTFMPWDLWRETYDRGTQTDDRPTHWTISPANEFCVGPAPDVAYTLKGLYRKGPQTLAADSDEPEMPSRFHNMIWRKGLMLMHARDESFFQLGNNENLFLQDLEELQRDQLPRVGIKFSPVA